VVHKIQQQNPIRDDRKDYLVTAVEITRIARR
jgi:hypothetical protein